MIVILTGLGLMFLWLFKTLVSDHFAARATIHQLNETLKWERAWAKSNDRATVEMQAETWDYLVKANARRKRFERALKKERAAHMRLCLDLSRQLGEALYETRHLKEENAKLTRFHRSLAADVVGELLSEQDRDVVTKGLTRKVKKR